MRYLGSKTLLLEQIISLIKEDIGTGVFCDPFGGIGTVGKYMKMKGYEVISGDVLYFAHCFQVALIENNNELAFEQLKKNVFINNKMEVEEYMNTLNGKDGWLVEEYARKRKYFTEENAKQIQACIECIQEWKKKGLLNEMEYKVLTASLIQSFDKVANTAGTYYAYLKDYYRKAQKNFCFNLIPPSKGNEKCKSYLIEANLLIKGLDCDILYLDPPYNERNYSRYYHLPENIARGIIPQPKGISGVYVSEEKKSLYNRRSTAVSAFEDLVNSAKAKCIIFHYTDNGLIKFDDVRNILKQKGKIDEFYFNSKGYSTIPDAKKCQHHIIRMRR